MNKQFEGIKAFFRKNNIQVIERPEHPDFLEAYVFDTYVYIELAPQYVRETFFVESMLGGEFYYTEQELIDNHLFRLLIEAEEQYHTSIHTDINVLDPNTVLLSYQGEDIATIEKVLTEVHEVEYKVYYISRHKEITVRHFIHAKQMIDIELQEELNRQAIAI